MIRLIQRRLIIPRGDTGTFTIPVINASNPGDIAVFTIFDTLKEIKVFQKIVEVSGDVITIKFTHEDTVNLPAGKYVWDIKFYSEPVIEDNVLVSGKEIDSYYAAFQLPQCEIKETGDDWLIAENEANPKLQPMQLNVVSALFGALNNAIQDVEITAEHYPKIINGMWYVWDKNVGDFVNTGVPAAQDLTPYMQFTDMEALSSEDINTITGGN